ncbi:MAG TPA: hypothetical protein VH637_14745 [Streptosporangiaceae bacterium]
MIFSIDHIVFAATPGQRDELMPALRQAGLADVGLSLDFPEDGVASQMLGYRGGGGLEFVTETDPRHSPAVWFAQVPRVIGVGFASDDFDQDTRWDGDPGAWVMDENVPLPDGKVLNIHAAGPHKHKSDFYVFVMDRRDGRLEFPALAGGPRLARITLAGPDAGWWHDRLARWLRLPASPGGGLAAGATELAFTDGPGPAVRATLSFAAAGDTTVLPLAAGAIELTREPSL